MADERISLSGLGPFHLPQVQRTSVRADKEGLLITLRVVGGDGTVPVNLKMLPRTAAELAAQISAAATTRAGDHGVHTTVGDKEIAALDTWTAQQPDPKPSRPEAIRLALNDWLTDMGLLKRREDPEGTN